MYQVLDLINLDEFVPLLVLICLLLIIGGQMTRPDLAMHQLARRLSAGTLLLYAAMGICTWQPLSVSDLLVILVRAILATGVVYGVATILLPVFQYVLGGTMSAIVQRNRQRAAESRQRAEQERAQREAAERERLEGEERTRRSAMSETERQRASEETTMTEGERRARAAEARAAVVQFYDQHESLISDALPRALFSTQLQNRFPAGVTPEQGWQDTRKQKVSPQGEAMAAASRQAKEAARRVPPACPWASPCFQSMTTSSNRSGVRTTRSRNSAACGLSRCDCGKPVRHTSGW